MNHLEEEATPVEVRRFSDEAKAALKKDGYIIYTLTGQSVASLREAGRKILRTWGSDYDLKFEALTSKQLEVAINPDRLILSNSNNLTLYQQRKMIDNFSIELGKKIPEVEAIMGGAPDYTDLFFAHLDATNKSLSGENYDYGSEPTADSLVDLVADFYSEGYGLVLHWRSVLGWAYDFAVPLVVPKA